MREKRTDGLVVKRNTLHILHVIKWAHRLLAVGVMMSVGRPEIEQREEGKKPYDFESHI